MSEISEKLLNQRIRNRIIEVLEVYCSIEDQEYLGPDEVINMWDDWVDDDRLLTYIEPVFTLDEQRAISIFHSSWSKVCDSTPQQMPPKRWLVNDWQWKKLMGNAKDALRILMVRGQLDEEQEIN